MEKHGIANNNSMTSVITLFLHLSAVQVHHHFIMTEIKIPRLVHLHTLASDFNPVMGKGINTCNSCFVKLRILQILNIL